MYLMRVFIEALGKYEEVPNIFYFDVIYPGHKGFIMENYRLEFKLYAKVCDSSIVSLTEEVN